MSFVDQAAVDEFAEAGVTVVRGVFRDWVDTVRDGIERNLKTPGPYTRGYTAASCSSHRRNARADRQRVSGWSK